MLEFAPLLIEYRYLIVFPLVLIGGPVVMVIGGFLLKLDYFSFLPLYLALMAADLLGDVIWYGIGYYGAHRFVKKYGHLLSITEELLAKTEEAFKSHQTKILFLSKITMGLGFALIVLMTAGMVRVPFKKYLAINALGQFAWTALLMGVGYSFGHLYLILDQSLRTMSLVAFITLVSLALYGFTQYLRRKDFQNKL